VIGGVDDILRDLQSAITVRRLYPSGHPRLHVLLDDLERGARAITTNRAEFSVLPWMDGSRPNWPSSAVASRWRGGSSGRSARTAITG